MSQSTIVTTIINQKGGVAKTTTCAEMACNMQKRGYQVLLVDMDPSANLSVAMLTDEMLKQYNSQQNPFPNGSVYDAIKNQASIRGGNIMIDPVYRVYGGVSIMPAPLNKMLANAEGELMALPTGREHILEEVLRQILSHYHYDFVFIDTPPSLGVLSINALTASDLCLVPCVAEPYSVQGVMDLNDTITVIKKYANPALQYAGVVMTRIKGRTNVHTEQGAIMDTCCKALNIKRYDTFIPESVVVPGAQGKNLHLTEYKASAAVAKQYNSLVTEFLEEVKKYA